MKKKKKMITVCCKSKRENFSNQIKRGNFYYIDANSIINIDGDEFAEVYLYSDGKKLIGTLNMSFFSLIDAIRCPKCGKIHKTEKSNGEMRNIIHCKCKDSFGNYTVIQNVSGEGYYILEDDLNRIPAC